MTMGFPAQVEMADDDATHIRTCVQYLQMKSHLGHPVDPGVRALVMQHIAAHFQQWEQKDPKAAHQARKELMKLVQGQPQPQGVGPAQPQQMGAA